MSDDYKNSPYWKARVNADGSLKPTAERDAYLAEHSRQLGFRELEERKRARETLSNEDFNHFAAHVEKLEAEIAIASPVRAAELRKGLELSRAQAIKHDEKVAARKAAEKLANDPDMQFVRNYIARHRDDYAPDAILELESIADVWKDEPAVARDKVLTRGGELAAERSQAAKDAHADARLKVIEANRDEARLAVQALEASHDLEAHGGSNDA